MPGKNKYIFTSHATAVNAAGKNRFLNLPKAFTIEPEGIVAYSSCYDFPSAGSVKYTGFDFNQDHDAAKFTNTSPYLCSYSNRRCSNTSAGTVTVESWSGAGCSGSADDTDSGDYFLSWTINLHYPIPGFASIQGKVGTVAGLGTAGQLYDTVFFSGVVRLCDLTFDPAGVEVQNLLTAADVRLIGGPGLSVIGYEGKITLTALCTVPEGCSPGTTHYWERWTSVIDCEEEEWSDPTGEIITAPEGSYPEDIWTRSDFFSGGCTRYYYRDMGIFDPVTPGTPPAKPTEECDCDCYVTWLYKLNCGGSWTLITSVIGGDFGRGPPITDTWRYIQGNGYCFATWTDSASIAGDEHGDCPFTHDHIAPHLRDPVEEPDEAECACGVDACPLSDDPAVAGYCNAITFATGAGNITGSMGIVIFGTDPVKWDDGENAIDCFTVDGQAYWRLTLSSGDVYTAPIPSIDTDPSEIPAGSWTHTTVVSTGAITSVTCDD